MKSLYLRRMPALILCGALLVVALLLSSTCRTAHADLVTFDVVATNQVVLGEEVQWQLYATVTGFQTPANNHGIDTLSVTLSNTGTDALQPGTISSAFSDYSFVSGGTVSGTSLVEIGATLFVQNNAVVEARDPVIGGTYIEGTPILLASGVFTPTMLGTFDLNTSAGSNNSFFTAANAFTNTGEAFTTAFNSASYSVSAVPEPGTGIVIAAGLLFWICRRSPLREHAPEH